MLIQSDIAINPYSQSKLSEMVKEKFKNEKITDEIMLDIIENKILFKYKHYIKISKILEIPLNSLLSYNKLNFETNTDNSEINDCVKKTINLFAYFIQQKNLINKEGNYNQK